MNENLIKLSEDYCKLEDEYRQLRNKLLLTLWEGDGEKDIKLIDKNDLQELAALHDEMEGSYKSFIHQLKKII